MEQKLIKFREEMEKEYENILNFWISKVVDNTNGGFHGEVDRFGSPTANSDKGVVLNTRILWTFSSAYNLTKNQAYLKTAHRAYDYIIKHFLDSEHGGLYWRLDPDGKVLDTRKQIYAQGFGIYGFSEYYKASGNSDSLNHAINLFRLIEKYSYDKRYGGYLEAFTREWDPMSDMRLSSRDANEPKSMNTHLHIIEPYTNLYRIWPDPFLAEQMRNLILVFLKHIIDSKTSHFNLFFETDWTVKSSTISYGHDIEGAWLLCEAAKELSDNELISRVNSSSLKMTDSTIAEGLAVDNSIFYEKNNTSGVLDTDRHWWVQAEAMVGFFNSYQISGNSKYLDLVMKVWDFVNQNIIDTKNGEWFLRVNNNGNIVPTDPKAGFWKCPYHNSRALMEILMRIENLEITRKTNPLTI